MQEKTVRLMDAARASEFRGVSRAGGQLEVPAINMLVVRHFDGTSPRISFIPRRRPNRARFLRLPYRSLC